MIDFGTSILILLCIGAVAYFFAKFEESEGYAQAAVDEAFPSSFPGKERREEREEGFLNE